MMEWCQSRGADVAGPSVTIVKKIFELGLNQAHVQSQPEYVKSFANWLVSALPIWNLAQVFSGWPPVLLASPCKASLARPVCRSPAVHVQAQLASLQSLRVQAVLATSATHALPSRNLIRGSGVQAVLETSTTRAWCSRMH